LRLYVDGKPAAQSAPFAAGAFDVSHDQPLWIGAGPHDFFNGRLSDLRIYRRALTSQEILRLAE